MEQSYLTLRNLYAALVLTQVEYKTLPDSTHDRPNNGLTIDRNSGVMVRMGSGAVPRIAFLGEGMDL